MSSWDWLGKLHSAGILEVFLLWMSFQFLFPTTGIFKLWIINSSSLCWDSSLSSCSQGCIVFGFFFFKYPWLVDVFPSPLFWRKQRRASSLLPETSFSSLKQHRTTYQYNLDCIYDKIKCICCWREMSINARAGFRIVFCIRFCLIVVQYRWSSPYHGLTYNFLILQWFWKAYTFNRNNVSNFEFWPFPRLLIYIHV